ncbi:MAG TPA: M56 family metallopeptidase [Terriglobia bacterium]
MVDAILHNLRPWAEQVIVISLAAALLPALIRLRHPRTQLAYSHLMLAVCLVLPFLQPWKHANILIVENNHTTKEAADSTADSSTSDQPSAVPARPLGQAPVPVPPLRQRIPTERFWLGILAVGTLARFSWLLAGLWKIRGYRIGATPLYPVPETVGAAAALTHADAMFCVSADVSGPVMLGLFCPVVLLPESFHGLDEEAQCGIATHELLHVRRNDWLVTLLEELAGTLLWFSPGIWWLLAQTRLAREQLVDAEAVRLTSARESYIQALLTIARSRQTLDLAAAPLFLRRRHLTQRMHFLLKDTPVSRPRLVSSYAVAAAAMGAAGWLSFSTFPLVGSPQFQRIASPSETKQPVFNVSAAAEQPSPQLFPRATAAVHADQTGRTGSGSVPPDAQEPVMVSIQAASTPAERAAALSLLEHARQNSDMHLASTPPFRIDATFQASGEVNYAGPGTLSETWLSGARWRWTASLAGYSQVRIGNGQTGFDEQPVTSVPLRVHMLRDALFWPVRFPPGTRIRTAIAHWNGKSLNCVLVNGEAGPGSAARSWSEQEYCLDNASGLLDVLSPAPGTYFSYHYGRSDFHGRFVPDQITASVDGLEVLGAQIAVSDANSEDVPSPQTAAYTRGTTLAAGPRFVISAPNNFADGSIQMVIVHAALSPAGAVLEEEVSTSSDRRLDQAALDSVRQYAFPPALTQREVFVSVGFFPAR